MTKVDAYIRHVTEAIKTQAKVRTGTNKMAAPSPKNRKRKTEEHADSTGIIPTLSCAEQLFFIRTQHFQSASVAVVAA